MAAAALTRYDDQFPEWAGGGREKALKSSQHVSRASIHGFLVFDWWHRRDEALRHLAEWQRAGKLRFKEDVLEGIERMPEAFMRLLYGKNFGKQIVRVN
jgi:NADPH-dependent curcumin reductase CurA